jgi:hypothetical protein
VVSGPTRFRSGSSNAIQILVLIRAIHFALHGDVPTASANNHDGAPTASLYPRCNIPSHGV